MSSDPHTNGEQESTDRLVPPPSVARKPISVANLSRIQRRVLYEDVAAQVASHISNEEIQQEFRISKSDLTRIFALPFSRSPSTPSSMSRSMQPPKPLF